MSANEALSLEQRIASKVRGYQDPQSAAWMAQQVIALVREQIAADIEAAIDVGDTTPLPVRTATLRRAAAIARGGSS